MGDRYLQINWTMRVRQSVESDWLCYCVRRYDVAVSTRDNNHVMIMTWWPHQIDDKVRI